MAVRAALEAARLEGGLPPGLVLALARRALQWLQVAARVDWSMGGPEVLGVEVPGSVEVRDAEGRSRWLRFTCDRADRGPAGGVVGTDYKSGRPISSASREDVRRRHLRQAIRKGDALQAAAYAGAAGAGGLGRYLFLRPDLDDRLREQSVAGDDAEVMGDFGAAVSTLLGAWDLGVFLPRLTAPAEGDPSPTCGFCEMREACVQYDSGMRRRLLAWMEAAGRDGLSASAVQLWSLGATTEGVEGGT
jgi:hypothetical protein